MSDDRTPEGWPVLDDGTYLRARTATLDAVRHPAAAGRLHSYYNLDSNYAAETFLGLSPNDSSEVTATDLLAVTLLSVDPPGPLQVRSITTPGAPEHDAIAAALAKIDVDADLAGAGAETLARMAELYGVVKSALGRNPWVTASKLCARKRPLLFPVRDRLVLDLLGLLGSRSTAGSGITWQVYRRLITDAEIADIVSAVVRDAHSLSGGRVRIEGYPLRRLDVLLWMHAKAPGRPAGSGG